MSSPPIPVYCFNWHMHQSAAQNEILIEPLSPYMQFDVTSWDGVHLDLSKKEIDASPLIFFFFPPPPDLLADPDVKLIWIPMWDEAKEYSDIWWKGLPKSLRIVAFSEQIHLKARAVGLPTLFLKYYRDPSKLKPVSWGARNTLFYWNRTGLVSRGFLRKICEVLNVEVLFFRRRIDPGWPLWCNYKLPQIIGNTLVEELAFDGIGGYSNYLSYLNRSNIFIAPRISEGVGLSFIEAMASGCAVFSCDAPTMNEYITNKKNGYLLSTNNSAEMGPRQKKIFQKIYNLSFRLGFTDSEVLHPLFRHPITTQQNWDEITGLDLRVLGDNARQDHLNGYNAWKISLPKFADFILNW